MLRPHCSDILEIKALQNIKAASILLQYTKSMVPTGTGNQGKPGKMGRHFPVREKSGNFFKTGKVRKFCPKYWKNRKI